jgi:hypothetical protein
MLTKSKTTGKRGALGLAPSLMALSLAAFGVPAGALLVPSVALAVDCSAPAVGDNVADNITCGYDSLGYTEIDITLVDEATISFNSTYVTTDGVDIDGSTDINETVTVVVRTSTDAGGPWPAPSITNSADGDGAFNISTSLAGQSVDFSLNQGSLSGTFAAGEGLYISTSGAGSNIAVTTLDGTTISSTQDDGVDLNSFGGGNITANIGGDITAGNNGGDVGLGAIVTSGGNIQLTLGGTADVTTSGNGVEAQVLNVSTGTITVTLNGAIIDADNFVLPNQGNPSNNQNGIYTNNTGSGLTTINLNDDDGLIIREASVTAGAGTADNGILALASGTGGISIYTEADISSGGDGIHAEVTGASGEINVTMYDTITSSLSDGIDVANAGSSQTDLEIYGDITANAANMAGIRSVTTGSGDTYIDTYWYSDINAAQDGIIATTSGNGLIDVDVYGDITTTETDGNGVLAGTTGTGSVSVHTGFFSEISAAGDGIDAYINNAGSSATLTVTQWGSVTSTTDDGIQTANNGSGLTDINVYGDITAGNSNNLTDAGIQANATGSGGLDIYTGYFSDITGTGLGIEARTNVGSGTLNVMVNGDVDTNFMEFYVNSNVANGATVTIGEYSEINTGGGMQAGASQQIMDALGGATEVNNYGTMYGTVDLTGSSDTFNNYSPDTWAFVGTSDFGSGDDVLNNVYTDSLTEGRIVNAVDGTTAETATYYRLENFNNDGLVTLVDQSSGDTFVRDRAYTTGNYRGGYSAYEGHIALDANLSTDTSLSDSDRFIIGGEAEGWTEVQINDVDTGFGAFGDVIPVIEIATAGGGGQFYLADPIDKGLYSYDLFYVNDLSPFDQNTDDLNDSDSLATDSLPGTDPTINEAWVLASYADASVNNLSAIPGIAANNWNALAEGWLERSGDLRNYFTEAAGPLAYAPSDVIMPSGETRDVGIWGRFVGTGGERTGSVDVEVLNDIVTLDTGYADMLVGGQGGIDFALHMDGSTLVVGVMGAYAQSEVAFNSGDSATITTPSVAAYADWIMGGTYFNALVKADFLGLDYNYGMDSDTTTGLALGGALEAGHRFQMDSFFIEPTARVSYVATQFDTFSIGPDEVDLSGESFEAKIGGRLGGSFATETYTIAPFVSGYVGYEFLGDSSADIDSMKYPVTTDFSGGFVEIGGGVNVDDVDGSGITGFASANVVLADQYMGASGSVGVRANF